MFIFMMVMLWWIIGMGSVVFLIAWSEEEYRIMDILPTMYFGLIGPIATLMVIYWKYEKFFGGLNSVLWKKSK